VGVAWSVDGDLPGSGRYSSSAAGWRAGQDRDIASSDPAARPADQPVRPAEGRKTVDRGPALLEAPASAPHVSLKPVVVDGAAAVPETPIARALRMIEDCEARHETVRDYICTFSKRERIDGRLTPLHVMHMKVRTRPQSIYLKFRQPAAGREAIYIAGRNDGKVLAHDVGLGRLIAGTLSLDPTGSRAMEDCRHPITEAGIGPLLDTVESRWSAELDPAESRVAFRDGQLVGPRPCTLIETTHPRPRPEFLFYQVRLFIDRDLGLPIRFEAYDWPANPQASPELVEEYTYSDLKLNIGLGDADFDVSNADYAFGRF
jgi:hypothetical protein